MAWSITSLSMAGGDGQYEGEGVDRACLYAKLEEDDDMSREDIDKSLEWLAVEGHIFSPVD